MTGSLKSSLGIEPFRWFLDKSRSVRLFSFPKLDGIAPSKLQLSAYSLVNCDRFPIDEGMIPEKLVLYKLSEPKFPNLPMLSGISPDMEVFAALNIRRLTRLPMSEGRLPEIPLNPTLSICIVCERFTIEHGICPVKATLECITNCSSWLQFVNEVMNSHPSLSFACSMLSYKYRVCRARNIPSGGGTYPPSLFCSRKSILRVVRLESEAGMDLVNWFVAKLRNFMLGNLLPISAGMLPWSMLPWRSSIFNEDRLYKEFGGSPERLFSSTKSTWRPQMLPRPGGMVPSRQFCTRTR